MRKAKTLKKIFVSFFVFFFVFSPIRFDAANIHFFVSDLFAGTPDDYGIVGDATLIEEDTTLTRNDTFVFDKKVFVVNGATLTIEPGVNVILGNDDPDSGNIGYLGILDGSIRALGTETEPVIFSGKTGHSFSIEFYNENPANEVSFLRYATVSGGGGKFDGGGSVGRLKQPIFQTAFAGTDGWGALKYYSGKVHIENSTFSGNSYADIEIENSLLDPNFAQDYFEVINSNFENNQDETALSVNDAYCSAGSCENRILLKDNWYGAPTGPRGIPAQNPAGSAGNGAYISGQVKFDGYRTGSLVVDPVVIVPGILGSQKNDQNQWIIDPILHSYDDIIDSLVANGYEKKYITAFPYDWYQKNEVTATTLKNKIQEILEQTKVSKVDIVAHSMGGLVARSYGQSDGYADDIDQLVTIGTPHKGSAKSYLMWEGGEVGITLQDKLLRTYLAQEAEEAGYSELFKYVRDHVSSVEQLLPVDNYLFDVSTQEMRAYPNEYPVNSFLESLNTPENIQELANIRELIEISGDTEVNDTIKNIRVINTIEALGSKKWEYGIPENFGDESTDQGLELSRGDQTVTLESAQALPGAEEITLKGTHTNLPDISQCDVFKSLSGKSDCQEVDNWHIPNILYLNVFSPIDIQIISPSGKKMGKNFGTGGAYNEIPGAYYTGYDTPNEFITIPNPEDGEYTILTQGTGVGEYRIEAVKITEGVNPGDEAKESVATFTGTVTTGALEEEKIEIIGDEVQVVEDSDVLPPTITISSPENKSYLNNQVLPITYSVTDNISTEANIQKTLTFNGNVFAHASVDLSLQPLGNHTLSIQATDEAGNATTAVASFQNTVTFTSLYTNVDHYRDLGLIKKKEEAKHIKAYLKYLEAVQEFIEQLKQMKYFPPKVRARLIQNFQRELEHKTEEFVEYLEKMVRKGVIDNQVKDRIVEAVEILVQQGNID